ncbi:AP-2 complex subunit alpha [Thraustotheca clavata]|uniref:AP-2 complex subunit alpha n=1 Tax=Thraustotheca clavata TaxID=74557 RepID=A0A1W0A1L8_9STRA|nr:AP-2 complex subunit alpha [Thraustotheca clavata]
MALFSARGLSNFISEIRSCPNAEEEQKRIDKELNKLRQKFTQAGALNSYDKKKYAWKLIYIYMLGYDVDFGHMQVINLVSGAKYSEKCLGYLGVSILLKSSDELMTLVVNSILNDLTSPDAAFQCLALCCVANLGGMELCETLAPHVVKLLMSSSSICHVRKKAALCVRRIIPAMPDAILPEELEPRLQTLMEDRHLGVVTSAAGLLQMALTQNPGGYKPLIEICIERLSQLVMNKACPRDYMYYSTPCPWLQIKLLRILQQYGVPEDARLNEKLNDTLRKILGRPSPGKGAKNNAIYAVLFETVNLVIAQGKRADPKLHEQGIQLLARFISVSEPNIRYIGLDSMNRLVRLDGVSDAIKEHKATVIFSLKDADNSVRRRALDLLFAMCDHSNALEIVGELVTYLAVADTIIREEIVLKAAILAERYAKDLRWYVDTVLQLITIAVDKGADVPDDVWHRVVQIVTNNEDLQKYTAEVMFRALEPKHVDETTAKFGAYVIGEFGYLIIEDLDMSSMRQFDVLYQHYSSCSLATKCLILTAFIKMDNLYEDIRPRVLEVFKKCTSHVDLETQQRACEYFTLHHSGDDTMKSVLEPMPVFPDTRESALVVRLRAQQQDAEGEAAPAREEQQGEELKAGDGDLLTIDSPVKGQQPSAFGGLRSPAPVNELDIFGGAPASKPSGVDPAKQSAWFNKIISTNQGVLFENDLLQIGVKQEFRGSQGRLSLFYGNKSPQTLSNVSAVIKPVAFLRVQAEELGNEVASKQQLKQQIMVECMQPFTQPAEMTVTYSFNGQFTTFDLKLPCVATCFLEPVKLTNDDFTKRWAALEGQGREQQEVFASSTKLDAQANIKLLTDTMKFGLGVDASGALALAGTFRTGTAAPTGDKISVGCLVRLEANAQANSYRLTVRAVHPDVSVAVKNILKGVLA